MLIHFYVMSLKVGHIRLHAHTCFPERTGNQSHYIAEQHICYHISSFFLKQGRKLVFVKHLFAFSTQQYFCTFKWRGIISQLPLQIQTLINTHAKNRLQVLQFCVNKFLHKPAFTLYSKIDPSCIKKCRFFFKYSKIFKKSLLLLNEVFCKEFI